MKIELREIQIQEVVQYSNHLKKCQGYKDNGEEGVYGMNGRLNIRPAYQREFIYKDLQRNEVINTIISNFPLNVLYWVVNKDGSYEVLDGQQRLISIGQYVNNTFSLNGMSFNNLTDDQRDKILNYRLMVYFCEGKTSEKLDWFKTINIAGEKLTDQELRNAVYPGPWLSNAKSYFSKTGCPAYRTASDYVKGSPIRQNYLETVLKWVSENNIEDYMSKNQHNKDAVELWNYFEKSISWFKNIFIKYRKEMKGLPIGSLYNDFSDNEYPLPDQIEKTVSELMINDEVTKKSGIYPYILTDDEKYLNIRSFDNNQKREAYEKQAGICVHCKKHFEINDTEADHITPWSKGGKTTPENCQILCLYCNRTKSSK